MLKRRDVLGVRLNCHEKHRPTGSRKALQTKAIVKGNAGCATLVF